MQNLDDIKLKTSRLYRRPTHFDVSVLAVEEEALKKNGIRAMVELEEESEPLDWIALYRDPDVFKNPTEKQLRNASGNACRLRYVRLPEGENRKVEVKWSASRLAFVGTEKLYSDMSDTQPIKVKVIAYVCSAYEVDGVSLCVLQHFANWIDPGFFKKSGGKQWFPRDFRLQNENCAGQATVTAAMWTANARQAVVYAIPAPPRTLKDAESIWTHSDDGLSLATIVWIIAVASVVIAVHVPVTVVRAIHTYKSMIYIYKQVIR